MKEESSCVHAEECQEEKHYPIAFGASGAIGWPGLIGAIRFRMDQAGLSEQDLIPFLGSEANVSQVLAGEMALTVPMMQALNEHLGIPAEMLLLMPLDYMICMVIFGNGV
jgi:HTH-type transcriptional regulator / antitoxin HigA